MKKGQKLGITTHFQKNHKDPYIDVPWQNFLKYKKVGGWEWGGREEPIVIMENRLPCLLLWSWPSLKH